MDKSAILDGLSDRSILFGLLFAFDNQLQTAGDTFYEGITSKQFFFTISLSLFRDHYPTINELSEVMGSSHQNVKQIANKLEKTGYIEMLPDYQDKRKIRIIPTDKLKQLQEKHQKDGLKFMDQLYAGFTDEEIANILKLMTRIENNLTSIRKGKS